MATPESAPEGWGAAARWYDQVIAPNTARYAEDALRAIDLRPGERVLDVAAGTGAFALLAARRGARVVATDFAPQMVERLAAKASQEELEGIEARVMDGQALALGDGAFDAVASVFGLIFFPDRVQGLREMRRVLRPGGRAVLVTWSTAPRVRVVSVVSDAIREALPDLPQPRDPPAIFSHADPARIRAEAREAGFTRVDVTSVTHAWLLPSAQSVWTDLAPSSPVFQALLGSLDEEQKGRVRRVVIEHATRAMKGGRVELPSEAHVAVLRA